MHPSSLLRRRLLFAGCGGLLLGAGLPRAFGKARPVLVGLDAEFMDPSSTADDAIMLAAQLAIDDINDRGGVLGGRPLQLVTTDNRSVPARGAVNVKKLAAMPDMTAYLGGKFSPVALEQLPVIHAHQLPLLAPWSAADAIVDSQYEPNYAFRVGLTDSLAMSRLLAEATQAGARRIGLLAPQTAWGRSCLQHLERGIAQDGAVTPLLAGVAWHYWGGSDERVKNGYLSLLDKGADTIILVANEVEGAALIRAVADQPVSRRRPILSHWGITGGRFTELCGSSLQHVDLVVVQSFNLDRVRGEIPDRLAEAAMVHFAVEDPLQIPSMTALGPAYDLVQLHALAIDTARTLDRPAIRDALEHLPVHEGVVKRYAPAFSATDHDALKLPDVVLCRFDARGRVVPHRP